MSKHPAPDQANTPNKRQRTGVGTSVATTETKETDKFMLAATQIRVERLQPKTRKIFTCERSDTLPSVFQKLVESNVLSLPVLTQKGEYHGIVEIFDIVRFVTEIFADISNTAMIDIEKLFASDTKFSKATVADVMQWPLKKNNPFHPVAMGYSLFSALEVLALSDAKRVPIIDANSQVVDVVTQSMMVDFLWQNIEMINKLADKKVEDIQPMRNRVVTQVDEHSKAIVAFREMVNRQEDYVAVVDKHGNLVDNLSLRDLRGIRPDVKVFYRLWNSVAEFKSKVREEFPDKTPGGVITVLPSDTLYQVVEIMAVKHVHHVFVVESASSRKPVRVISQTDVLREILAK
jgi:CBS domain-containing protein